MAFHIINAISRCKLSMVLDEITQGDGNCFPHAVVQQCKRREIKENIKNSIKMMANNFDLLRNAVCDFMLNISHPCIEMFRQSYIANEFQISRISWDDYWFAMRQNKVWVDYKFIQGTAWYLCHDILIVTTKSMPTNPFIYISGNKENKNIPCTGVPLLIGSQLDWHFQSLLPKRDMNEDTFLPSRSRGKTECANKIKKTDRKPNHRKLNRCRPTFQDALVKNLTYNKNWKEICPNCQKKVASLKIHFLTSVICKQTSLLKDNNKPSRSPKDKGEISRKKVTGKKSENTRCKGCDKEQKSIANHLKKAFTCQNMYGLNDALDEYMCSDDDYAPIKTKQNVQNRKKNNKIENKPSKFAKEGRKILKPFKEKVSMDKEKKEPPTTNNYKNKSQKKKSKFNCKFFKNRICFNKGKSQCTKKLC